MRILAVSDEESKYFWDFYKPGKLSGIDLILSAGDVKSEYLSFLVTMANRPLLYIHGNHDGNYAQKPPEGCECIEDRIVRVNGLRILGLGGTRKYNNGSHQYTERQMEKRIRRLWWKLYRSKGVDIVVTHSPPAGVGDADDYAHRGFEAFLPLMEKYKPAYLVHGHVHKNYSHNFVRERQYASTTVINSSGYHIFEI